MTDAQKLKRHPAVILRRAMTHLRKRWSGHKGYNGRENMLILKRAVADVMRADFEATLAYWRESRGK